MKTLSILLFIILGFLFITVNNSAVAVETINGAEIFQIHCSGCHPNGSNIIRRGKNLRLKTLQRNKLDTLEAITDLVTYGKNNMSAYQEKLTPQEIEAVSHYVLEQANHNWKS
ncbi:c-type cytochrome [Crocosphaera sp. XPORK-15E]|uniref:c-type cytochrome n=1 Tax=Crocosphaera sp. XPORK-15E TaxID=3110247 RepID=UPI002B1F1CBA|nr:c-type cytochrome [Crocosphaera sp. XPORK-15E]MEA5534287.1 c-type cytochrome [Crocosphaera sp. XPORK-15E]